MNGSDDLFAVFADGLRSNPLFRAWQVKFRTRIRNDRALKRYWTRLLSAGCEPTVLESLLYIITDPASLRAIDRHRDQLHERTIVKKKRVATAAHLANKMRDLSLLINENAALLKSLFDAEFEHVRSVFLNMFLTAPPDPPNLPTPKSAGVPPSLVPHHNLLLDLNFWVSRLDEYVAMMNPVRRRGGLDDAQRFSGILSYVALHRDPPPFSAISALAEAAFLTAKRPETVTPDQLRMLWKRKTPNYKKHERKRNA